MSVIIMKHISNLNVLINNVQREEFFVIGPRIDLQSFSIIPHLRNGKLKLVLDVAPLIFSNSWSRSNLLYVYSLFIDEVMKNNVRIYVYNSKNDTKEEIYHRNFEELKSLGKLLGITNKEQILMPQDNKQ